MFEAGTKKKAWQKRNAVKGISRSADRDKGCAPLTAPPFEKGGRKLLAYLRQTDMMVKHHMNEKQIAKKKKEVYN